MALLNIENSSLSMILFRYQALRTVEHFYNDVLLIALFDVHDFYTMLTDNFNNGPHLPFYQNKTHKPVKINMKPVSLCAKSTYRRITGKVISFYIKMTLIHDFVHQHLQKLNPEPIV
jgi:hypothetical protein